ncbi:MAG TPA: hypothetical protein VFD58_28660 [Blastocatellia bacterium]|nr:hypothetical protein [Blastocatellia bacterium]
MVGKHHALVVTALALGLILGAALSTGVASQSARTSVTPPAPQITSAAPRVQAWEYRILTGDVFTGPPSAVIMGPTGGRVIRPGSELEREINRWGEVGFEVFEIRKLNTTNDSYENFAVWLRRPKL